MGSKTNSRTWTNEQLIEAVKISQTYCEVARNLGLKTFGANSKTIKKYISILKLDIAHFLTKKEQMAHARSKSKKAMSDEEMFSINDVDRKYIKDRIIKKKIIPYHCEQCKITEWQGKLLSLHLDHINGINNDNRLENLRFLCPNCHSQTDTYCGKQLKDITRANKKCVDCQCPIHHGSTRCRNCSAKHKNKPKINWPATSILITMVEEFGYTGTGRKLGVTDNTVKKRILNYPDSSGGNAPKNQFEKKVA